MSISSNETAPSQSQAPSRRPRVRAPELTGRRWLNTGGKDLTLKDLRGKVVLLDFWTFCCINCLHVLDELRPLEEKYRDSLVILGVHSPKFEFERTVAAVDAAVDRYAVAHPVLDDPNLETWQAYTARAWPTLVVVDPEGYVAANLAGEGHAAGLAVLIEELIAEHSERGTLNRGDGPYVPPPAAATELKFPGKAIALPDGGYLVSDSGHHRLVEFAPDGETVRRRIGSGERGFTDGTAGAVATSAAVVGGVAADGTAGAVATSSDTAADAGQPRFSEPQGLTLLPPELAARVGYDVVVADTVNHALRGLRLADGAVTTLAGTGEQYMVGAADNRPDAPGMDGGRYDGDARGIKLSSPWDVLFVPQSGTVLVAMAGNHTLWTFDPAAGTVADFAGTMNEGLLDGPAKEAWFAQTSGLAVDRSGRVWIADSETSSLRSIDLGESTISTAIGEGLFDFGFRDGDAGQARLQHPLGVTVLPDGSIAVSDTYNGAIRRFDPESNEVTTLARDLAEPSDALVAGSGTDDDPYHLLVVESAAHSLTRVAIPADAQRVDDGAKSTTRPATEIGAGALTIDIGFSAPAGQKLDHRYGDPTWLQISATPPELLVSGGGGAEGLSREITIADGVVGGILHVTARAAACDGDPITGEVPEHAACHLYSQDWGIPVTIAPGAASSLSLDLRGV